MEGEINNFIKVWIAVIISLCYCYTIGKIIPKGLTRLLTILPVVCLFLFLPLNLTTIHLGGITGFFIAWLSNFKLLLFAFGKGPLSSLSLSHFIAVGCLPIKIQHNPSPNTQNGEHPSSKTTKKITKSPLNYTIKAFILAILVPIYNYSNYIHPTVILILYCLHIYFTFEILQAMVAALVRILLGLELEPPFNEPCLSTSLQDFWERRWNIIVSTILRQTVYDPILHISTIHMGRKWAYCPAVLGAFGMAGLMHELIFYYVGRAKPTWEVMCFFLIHGSSLLMEVALKNKLRGRVQLHRFISGPLTVGFFVVTQFWLFLPELLRCKGDVRAFEEYAAVGVFVKDIGRLYNESGLWQLIIQSLV